MGGAAGDSGNVPFESDSAGENGVILDPPHVLLARVAVFLYIACLRFLIALLFVGKETTWWRFLGTELNRAESNRQLQNWWFFCIF